MNLKSPLIVATILLATTLASADFPVEKDNANHNGNSLALTVSIDEIGFIDVLPATLVGNDWVKRTSATVLDPTTLLATILVETNVAQWDILVKSPKAGFLTKTAGTAAAKGDTLKAITSGTTSAAAKLQLFICTAPTDGSTPCTVTNGGSATATTGKVGALTAAGIKLGTFVGRTNGFKPVSEDMSMSTVPGGVASKNKALSTPTPAPYAHLGIYGGLMAGTVAVEKGLLVGSGNFTETLDFSLVAAY